MSIGLGKERLFGVGSEDVKARYDAKENIGAANVGKRVNGQVGAD